MRMLMALMIILFANSAYSIGKADKAKVASVRVDRNGWGIVEFDREIVYEPATCRNSGYNKHFSFDTNTEGGKAVYAMVLAAAASGNTITAYGTGNCSEYVNIVESWSYGEFKSN